MSNLKDIFKVPLYQVKLNFDVKKLQSFCKEWQHNHFGESKSNRGGYQSSSLPKDDPLIYSLIQELEYHSTSFANEFINNKKHKVDNLWININGYKDSNATHTHPNSILSGAYYVNTPKDCGDLQFEHPAIDILTYYMDAIRIRSGKKLAYDNPSMYNAASIMVPAIENSLYIFPSWLKHSVRSNQNIKEERISISFNTLFKAK